tara:strand:+ start:119 stop:400 length:282 start_codon:yes stop_codon:yes gene_type:complete
MKAKAKTIDDLIKKYKNKKGDDEAESIIIDNNGDRRIDGFVRVWAMAADISRIAERCKNSIVWWKEEADHGGCHFHIDRKAFRGVVYAFRNVK